MALISSIILTKKGSRWPTSGCAMARRTDGATLLGPGPSSNRGGGLNADGICMSGNDTTINAQDNDYNAMRNSARRTDNRKNVRQISAGPDGATLLGPGPSSNRGGGLN